MTADRRHGEHTPGPWDLWTDDKGAMQIAVDGFVICSRNDVEHRAAESVANARLIAAAPELEAELDYIVSYFEGGIMPLDLREWKQRAIAALKKAEGRA